MDRFWRRSGWADGVEAGAWVSRPAGPCGDADVVTLAVEYVDADGVARRGTVDVSRPKYRSLEGRPAGRYWLVIGTPGFAVGDRVRVRYDPDRPEVVYVDSFVVTWLPILALNGVAAGCGLVSLAAGVGLVPFVMIGLLGILLAGAAVGLLLAAGAVARSAAVSRGRAGGGLAVFAVGVVALVWVTGEVCFTADSDARARRTGIGPRPAARLLVLGLPRVPGALLVAGLRLRGGWREERWIAWGTAAAVAALLRRVTRVRRAGRPDRPLTKTLSPAAAPDRGGALAGWGNYPGEGGYLDTNSPPAACVVAKTLAGAVAGALPPVAWYVRTELTTGVSARTRPRHVPSVTTHPRPVVAGRAAETR